jgi:hypothetical protein
MLLLTVVAVVFLIYMLAESTLTFTQIVAFVMALGNTYGLILLTAFLGSGLVALPKRLWELSDSSMELKRLYIQAVAIEDSFQDARYALEDVEYEVDELYQQFYSLQQRQENVSDITNTISSFASEIEKLHEVKESFVFDQRSQTRKFQLASSSHSKNVANNKQDTSSSTSGGLFSAFSSSLVSSTGSGIKEIVRKKNYDKSAIVLLHARLLRCQLKAMAATQRWFHHIKRIQQFEASLTSTPSNSVVDSGVVTSKEEENNFFGRFRVSQRYLSGVYRLAALMCIVCSLIVFWSELVLGSHLPSLPGLLLGCSYSSCGSASSSSVQVQQVYIQLISFFFLFFISGCTYLTLFRINLGGYYRLQGPKMSSFPSLLINAQYFSRLQFSIGYNFIVILHVSRANEDCVFAQWMQHNMEDVLPIFGASFLYFVPVCLCVFVLISSFDGYARLLRWLGVETEESLLLTSGNDKNEDELLEKYQQGKNAVLAELKRSKRLAGTLVVPTDILSTKTAASTTMRPTMFASAANSNNSAEVNNSVVDASPFSWAKWTNFYNGAGSASVSNVQDSVLSPVHCPPNNNINGLFGKKNTTYSRLGSQTDENDGNTKHTLSSYVLDDSVELGQVHTKKSKSKGLAGRDLFSLLDDKSNSSNENAYGRYS